MKKLLTLIVVFSVFYGCKDEDDTQTSPADPANLTITLSESWDKSTVSNNDLSTTVYINENGEELIINRLRYLISNVVLTHEESQQEYFLATYRLRDIAQTDQNDQEETLDVPSGTYTVSFVYGFNENDNLDGAYPDLNLASWNWPAMLGGGYHFMQLDGSYNVKTEPAPFNFHNGTARKEEGVFEQNYVEFSFTGIEVTAQSTAVKINMDVAEWFKNPHTWNLNELDTPLMPNYTAQKLMQDNAESVFSVSIE